MSNIYLEGSSWDDFMAKLISILKEIVKESKHNEIQESETLLTRQETAEMLKISLPTLHTWTKEGVLTPRYLGRRVYYKKSEIINNPKSKKS